MTKYDDKHIGRQLVGMHPGASEYAFEYQQVSPIRLADAPRCIPIGWWNCFYTESVAYRYIITSC